MLFGVSAIGSSPLPVAIPAIDRFAHGRLEAFDVTHAPHLEAPEAFETSLERYLDEVGWRRPQSQPSAMAM